MQQTNKKYSKSVFFNRQFSKTRKVEVARQRCQFVFWTSTTTLPNLCWPLTTSTSQSILVGERWLIPSQPRIRIKTKYAYFVIRYYFLYTPKRIFEKMLFSICFLLFSSSGFWFPREINIAVSVSLFHWNLWAFPSTSNALKSFLPCILILVILALLISKKTILVTHLPRIGEVGVKIPTARELSR